MVSTRNHPSNFPPPDLSPSKPTSTTGTPEPTASPSKIDNSSPRKSSTALTKPRGPSKRSSTSTAASKTGGSWSHTPSHIVLLWLTISLPLVAWDTSYIFLRPYSMPGGSLHAPIWKPYAIYANVDLVYGFPAWDAKDGFTAAQASLNVVESLVYLAYLFVVERYGVESGKVMGRGKEAAGLWARSWWGRARVVGGGKGGTAVLLGLVGSVMTASKTVLYAMNEYHSGFKHTGHNAFVDLLFYYIIPNGAWLVFSTWMTYVFSAEILEGLSLAAGAAEEESNGTKEE